jgi:phage shock protein PspC (stress-responsive transcriptional regulator)
MKALNYHNRPDGALLAGVCAGIARAFEWNVWVLRALFFVFLLIKTIAAIAMYAVLALLFYFVEGTQSEKRESSGLASPELSERSRRIDELDRKFREWEKSQRG